MTTFLHVFLFFCIFFSVFFILSFVFYTIYFVFVKKMKRIKNYTRHFKQHSVFVRLFFDFPRQFILDKLTLDPNVFKEYGLHLLCGEQGSGKTMLMNYLIKKYKRIYPRLKVRTNFAHVDQDFELNSWEDLTLNTNG